MTTFKKHFTLIGWQFRNREVRAWTSTDSKFTLSPITNSFFVKGDNGQFHKLDETQVLEGLTKHGI